MHGLHLLFVTLLPNLSTSDPAGWVLTSLPLPEAASHVIVQWLPERRPEIRSFAAGSSLVHSKTKSPQLGCWPGIRVQLFGVKLLASVTPTSCSLYCCQIMCARLQFRFGNNKEAIKLFGFYFISYDLGVLTSSHPEPASISSSILLILGPLPLPIPCVVVGQSITILLLLILPRRGRPMTQPKPMKSSLLEMATVKQRVWG